MTACEDAAGEKRLVAYLVTQDPDSIDHDQLRELLRSKLPDYMIPAAFVNLEKISSHAKRQDRPQSSTQTNGGSECDCGQPRFRLGRRWKKPLPPSGRRFLALLPSVGTQIFSISAATRFSSDGLIRN